MVDMTLKVLYPKVKVIHFYRAMHFSAKRGKGYYALSLTCLENTYRSFFAYLFYFTDVIDIVYFCNRM